MAKMTLSEKIMLTCEALIAGATLLGDGRSKVETAANDAAINDLMSWHATEQGGGSADEIRRKIRQDLREEFRRRGWTSDVGRP